MGYPSSGSRLGSNNSVGLSTQIVVKVGNSTVGAIQSFTQKQTRGMTSVEEIGSDGIIEIHPKGSTKVTITVNRIVFDNLRLAEAFGRGYVNIQAQRIPFDICILDRSTVTPESGFAERQINKALGAIGIDSNLSAGAITRNLSKATNILGSLGGGFKEIEPYVGHIVHTFNNCWFTDYSTSYKADNFVIIEDATISCEFVTSMRDSRNVATGGSNGIQYDYDSIERATDLAGVRGKFYAVVDDRGFGRKLLDALF